ncbi:MAG: SIS domain-containing protein [Flavitalea sp.]
MINQNNPTEFLFEKGALHTSSEIANQPILWKQSEGKFYRESKSIESFLQQALNQCDEIILTGAGTSAFIGISLQGIFFSRTHKMTRAIATTDIISHPHHYLSEDRVPLIISFARSGKSPESCAALELADQICKKCFHLIITCNSEGLLANYDSCNLAYVCVLPSEANDKGLAMTGSYSSMLLIGLLIAFFEEKSFCQSQVRLLISSAEKIFKEYSTIIQAIAEKDFHRAVFLGSGPLFGTATEAALKLQELTDGQIVCKADTFLGFRHGPKAVIDETTLVVYFFSNDKYAHQYEIDLLEDMKRGNSALFHLGISEQPIDSPILQAQVILGADSAPLSVHFLPVCSILPAQLLGLYKSLNLGLEPDTPSISGAISRVVEGVIIYPVVI